MAFEIVLTFDAIEDLRRLKASERSTVRAALETHLRHEPTKLSRSRIKRLRSFDSPQYRLRVTTVRVFYDVAEKVVTIHAIVRKPEADAWLAQFGNRQ